MSEAEVNNGLAAEGKRVGRNAVLLVGSRFAALLLAVVQTAIIGNGLSVEGSGQFLFALGFTSLFTVFATLGIQRVLVRDITRDTERRWDYVWSATAMTAILTFVSLLAITGSTWFLSDDPSKRWAVVMASFSVVGFWALQRPFEAVLIAYERMGWLAWVNLAGAVIKVAVIWLAFQLMNATWEPFGSAIAHGAIAVANLLVFILCVSFAFYVGGWHRPRVSLGIMWKQVRECVPVTAAMLFSLLYFKSDIFLLERTLGDTGTGIYFPVQRLMEPLLMTAGLWGTAIFPALCRMAHTDAENYAQLKQSSLRLVIMLSCPMAVGVAVLAEPLVNLLTGPEALIGASTMMMRAYAIVIPFFFFNGIAQEILYAVHRNWLVVGAFALAAALSVGLNLYVLPQFGYLGLCYAAIASNAAVTAVFICELHRELGGMKLPTLLVRVGAACGLMGVVAYGLAPFNLFLAAGVGALVYGLLLVLLHAFDETEEAMLRGLLRRKPSAVSGGSND